MKRLLPLFVFLIENSSNYFSACQSVRGVFFLPNIIVFHVFNMLGLFLTTTVVTLNLGGVKWGMASSAACECGAEEQTVDHVVLQCQIHRPVRRRSAWTASPDGSGR